MAQEQGLADTFVELSGRLVDDYDVVDLLHTVAGCCVHLLDAQAAGVLVADQDGALQVLATSPGPGSVELFEAESTQGPGMASFAAGVVVADLDLDAPDRRWQRVGRRAHEAGFRSAHAMPIRLHDDVIGVLHLLRVTPGPMGEHRVRTWRALANVAAIALLQHRAEERQQSLAEHLQQALNNRVVIEQAKGVLAERLQLDLADAFTELRRHTGRTGGRLSDTARDIVEGGAGGRPGTADSGRGAVLLVTGFGRKSLSGLRGRVRAQAAGHRLDELALTKLVLAVHEAAVNAVRHGGGRGRLWLWHDADSLWCEVSDQGRGMPPDQRVPRYRPSQDQIEGRGLWLIGQICSSLEISSDTSGTRLLMRFALDPAPVER